MTSPGWRDWVALLDHSEPEDRLEAIRLLRESAEPEAGPSLLEHLRRTLSSEEEWIQQHALIGALGACRHAPALEVFEELVVNAELCPEVEEALGQAIVRLSVENEADVGPVLRLLASGRSALAQGALEAMARLRLVPSQAEQSRLVEFALGVDLAKDAWSLIWILRAAPGWGGEAYDRLLSHYGAEEYRQLRQVHGAVVLAQERKYRDWARF